MRKNTISNQFMDFSVVGKMQAPTVGKRPPEPQAEQATDKDKDRDAGTKESKDV